jgi:benzoyl-CoA reductase/2-hydroxyglutaryl-CoA dehydratase subunit BcrC/BadD/HgdB
VLTEPLKSWKVCKELANNFYEKQRGAKQEGKTIVWGGASIPCDIIRAMDIVPILGEPYGALCAAHQLSEELMEATEEYGFGRSFCAYARNFVGSALKNKGPLGEMPEPDFIMGTKAGCNDHITWFEVLARIKNKPYTAIDVPMLYEEPGPHHLKYLERQLNDFLRFLEETTGRKADEERFVEFMKLAHQARGLWTKVLEFCRNIPAPLNFKSQLSLMMPAVSLKGTKEAVDFYGMLLDELEDRVKKGIVAVPQEKARLLWDNIPMWYYMQIFNYVEQKGAVVVVSPYVQGFGADPLAYADISDQGKALLAWQEPSTLEEALREVAKEYLRSALRHNLPAKVIQFSQIVKDYSVDGCLIHSNAGCKNLSCARPDLVRKVEEDTGVPTLMFQASNADPQDFNEEETLAKVDRFIDELISGATAD